jgi:hypothetical protein
LSHIKELIAWRASKTLSCQRETLHSQQLRSIKKSIDSDHGIYRNRWRMTPIGTNRPNEDAAFTAAFGGITDMPRTSRKDRL